MCRATIYPTSTDLSWIRLGDADFYGDPWDGYATLRRSAPVFWYEPAECWVVSRYADVKRVCTDETFSTAFGATMGPQYAAVAQVHSPGDLAERTRAVLAARDVNARKSSASPDAEHLLRIDPPRHGQVRDLIKSQFTPRRIADWETFIRDLAEEAFDALPADRELDFVEAVATPIPLYVVARLLGVDRRDRPLFKRWTDTVMWFNDGVGNAGPEEIAELEDALRAMYEYFRIRLEAGAPALDSEFLAQLVGGEIDGEPMTLPSMQTLCRVILVGGNETTRHLMSGAALALAQHPEQRELLIEQPELLDGAVEEFLRWTTPSRHVCRTATVRTEIAGQTIESGEYVMALLASANRDETVWPDADRLDVTRPIRPRHMSFAWGTHMCLGQHLPRLEAKVVLGELLRRFPRYALAGEPRQGRLLILDGLESLPMVMSPQAVAA
jgi:cytochrome P450